MKDYEMKDYEINYIKGDLENVLNMIILWKIIVR